MQSQPTQLEQRPCRDAHFVEDCRRNGLHLSMARRWLIYAHGMLLGAPALPQLMSLKALR
jgi:hypothetical protein